MGLINWLFDNLVKGFLFAAVISATEFFVTGIHIGEPKFLMWLGIGFIVVTITRVVDAIHRANIIMEKLKNDH